MSAGHIGPDDLLVLAPGETSPAQVALNTALRQRFRDGEVLWVPSHPSDHPPSGEAARSIAAQMLVIRSVQSEELPSSSDRVKFVRITIDAVVFTHGAEHPFQCAHNGLGPSADVALQQAADRCARKLLDQLGH